MSERVDSVPRHCRHRPDTAEKTGRHLLDNRVAAVRELATRRADSTRARDTLAAEERADTAAWTNAEKAGWTEAELRQVGFTAPSRRRPGRPRKNPDS